VRIIQPVEYTIGSANRCVEFIHYHNHSLTTLITTTVERVGTTGVGTVHELGGGCGCLSEDDSCYDNGSDSQEG